MAKVLVGLRKGSGRGSGRRPTNAERPPSRTAFPLRLSGFLVGGAYIALTAVCLAFGVEAAPDRPATGLASPSDDRGGTGRQRSRSSTRPHPPLGTLAPSPKFPAVLGLDPPTQVEHADRSAVIPWAEVKRCPRTSHMSATAA